MSQEHDQFQLQKPVLPQHGLNLVLVQPQIAANTGNIARLCVATSTKLHLVRPMGFVLSDKHLKRAAMDYWQHLMLTVHDDANAFFQHLSSEKIELPEQDNSFLKAEEPKRGRPWLFSSKASRSFWTADFARGDYLVLGSESSGLSESFTAAALEMHADCLVTLPQAPDQRCLNVSTAAGIALYEALRQIAR